MTNFSLRKTERGRFLSENTERGQKKNVIKKSRKMTIFYQEMQNNENFLLRNTER